MPTVVFTAADLAALTARGEELHAEHDPSGQHYVTLYASTPTTAAVEAAQVLEEFFGKIETTDDLAALAAEYDAKITPMLNGQ